MEPTPFPFALWLRPDNKQYPGLKAHIDNLSLCHGTQAFEPHVTLCSGTSQEDLSILINRLDRLAAGLHPFSFRVRGLGGRDDYFRFLYLELEADEDPGLLYRATSLFPGTHPPPIGPHLSLMYAEPDSGIARDGALAAMVDQVPERLRIEALQLVVPSHGQWRDIETWQVRREITLAERPAAPSPS